MNWLDFLQTQRAKIENGYVMSFGHFDNELQITKNADIVADLSHLSLIKFSGNDTQTFLQSQLSNDIKKININQAQYSCYCSPKGRVLANFLIGKIENDYYAQLSNSLVESIQKRLSMFVLRSKVTIMNATNHLVRLGVAGRNAANSLDSILGSALDFPLGIVQIEKGLCINLGNNRFQLLVLADYAPTIWSALTKKVQPVGTPCWEWLDIQAGFPWITSATQEQFTPQMINFDLLGGISFTKGCYPGQEIVARTKHLGQIKRRTYLAHIETNATLSIGEKLVCPALDNQVVGEIIQAQRAPNGGYDVLAVIQISTVGQHAIYLASSISAELQVLPLPYSAE